MRKKMLLGFLASVFVGAGFVLLMAVSAEASVRDEIMARREASGKWDCSSGDCRLASGRTAGEARTPRAPSQTSAVEAPAPEAPAPEAAPVAQAGGPARIEISIAEQRLRAYEGDRLVLDTLVSTGTAQYPTPTGTYSIKSKEAMHWSTQYGVWMPNAMRVVNGIFIHEMPVTTDGRRIGDSEIGSPASHGCIRVPSGTASRLYDWARIGTPVVIY